MSKYIVEWDSDSVQVMKTKPKNLVEGKPLSSHQGKAVLLLDQALDSAGQPVKQAVVVGMKVPNLRDPYWTWATLTNAVVSVFGYQLEPATIEVLYADKSGHVASLYHAQHGKAFV